MEDTSAHREDPEEARFKRENPLVTPEEMLLWAIFGDAKKPPTDAEAPWRAEKAHRIQQARRREVEETGPPCPECGKSLVRRIAWRSGGVGPFWGCSSYPECRGAAPFSTSEQQEKLARFRRENARSGSRKPWPATIWSCSTEPVKNENPRCTDAILQSLAPDVHPDYSGTGFEKTYLITESGRFYEVLQKGDWVASRTLEGAPMVMSVLAKRPSSWPPGEYVFRVAVLTGQPLDELRTVHENSFAHYLMRFGWPPAFALTAEYAKAVARRRRQLTPPKSISVNGATHSQYKYFRAYLERHGLREAAP